MRKRIARALGLAAPPTRDEGAPRRDLPHEGGRVNHDFPSPLIGEAATRMRCREGVIRLTRHRRPSSVVPICGQAFELAEDL